MKPRQFFTLASYLVPVTDLQANMDCSETSLHDVFISIDNCNEHVLNDMLIATVHYLRKLRHWAHMRAILGHHVPNF